MSQSCKVKPDCQGGITGDVLIFYVHINLLTFYLKNIVRLKRHSLVKLG